MLTNPCTALVVMPSDVRRSAGTAKKARKTSEFPSSRYRAPSPVAGSPAPPRAFCIPAETEEMSGSLRGERAVQNLAGNLLHADPAVHRSALDEVESVHLGELVLVH